MEHITMDYEQEYKNLARFVVEQWREETKTIRAETTKMGKTHHYGRRNAYAKLLRILTGRGNVFAAVELVDKKY
jgi:hypothetical protein